MEPILDRNPPHTLRGLRFFRLLLWAQWRMMLARLRGVRRQSPLLLVVLGGFVTAYLAVGYFLFHEGLGYLHRFPLIGALLSQRLLFLVFLFFFLMLVFSNLIISYSTLFKNRETAWFLTLPIPHRDVYCAKFGESLVVSSWALVFLSAPLMTAFGRVHEVDASFYAKVALAYLPFIVLPALLGSWMILLLVRFLSRPWAKHATLAVAAAAIIAIIVGINPVSANDAASSSEIASFDRLLKHTRMSLNPNLPSAWIASSVLAWSDRIPRQGNFFALVLASNALMGLLVGFAGFQRLFYGSWSATISARAERFQRKAEAKRRRRDRRDLAEILVEKLPRIGRPIKALVLKDARLFSRDPAQWTQFIIFFGLLCIYVLNLRNVAFNFRSEFWETMISFLNLAASALTLSTLTTRFVFPQFSLEGRRLWILGLAPIGLQKIVMQKFWLASLTTTCVTAGLMAASSLMLNLPWKSVLFFTLAITVMSTTLSGLAVGLGALFPNLKEDNPSKIVSGFGGTLCLVVSFVYIVLFVGVLAAPPVMQVLNLPAFLPRHVAMGLALAVSAATLGIPLSAALRRLKNLEF